MDNHQHNGVVAIIYHSQTGHALSLAEAAAEGVEVNSALCAKLYRALDTDLEALAAARAVIFATPENFGTMSGGLKDFFDRTFYPAEPLQLNTPYAALISAGNDGRGALRDIERIAKGYPLRKAAEAVIVRGEITEQDKVRARELGGALACGAELGIF
ncbi:MAG: flavodoxin family protein [Porticoccaceae bacterium]